MSGHFIFFLPLFSVSTDNISFQIYITNAHRKLTANDFFFPSKKKKLKYRKRAVVALPELGRHFDYVQQLVAH